MNDTGSIEVDVQAVSTCSSIPEISCFQCWAEAALSDRGETLLSIRLVDRTESAELNQRFRSKPGPTNVLSFAAELPAEVSVPLLGDIVICAPLVVEEATSQGKEIEAHWAHLVIHGILHLLGFDHQSKADAEEMEAREVKLLASLGYPDPYA
ncbi:MAG TPA: rRNA maturation RNase YbeY [Xanthomonadales bacterium]|nr:rRNA maturation RNase YbeY [Xanthomonadales bacterium]